ncbi:MAG: hypothetical protein DHS20C21_08030 [Gemmatimonadota bacterium]|nr:MAG: hypothetical protein DHS20C21_08030 [Gemmatimonadota bacterium]
MIVRVPWADWPATRDVPSESGETKIGRAAEASVAERATMAEKAQANDVDRRCATSCLLADDNHKDTTVAHPQQVADFAKELSSVNSDTHARLGLHPRNLVHRDLHLGARLRSLP